MNSEQFRIPTIREVQTIAADHFGVSIVDLVSERQSRKFLTPRYVAIWVCHKLTASSLARLGRAFRRDPTTIASAIERTTWIIRTDPVVAQHVKDVSRRVEELVGSTHPDALDSAGMVIGGKGTECLRH